MRIEEEQRLRIQLLELEIECLRSVLSEYEDDKTHHTQWLKAEAIKILLNFMRRY